MTLHPDLREFLESLNASRVDFVIVGAHALAYHGHPRLTGDIDILVYPSRENAERVIQALIQFGFGSLGYVPEDLLTPGDFIQLGVIPNRIDLLNQVSGVSNDDIWAERIASHLDNIPVHYIGREHFIRNKRATGRQKDLGDLESLGEV